MEAVFAEILGCFSRAAFPTGLDEYVVAIAQQQKRSKQRNKYGEWVCAISSLSPVLASEAFAAGEPSSSIAIYWSSKEPRLGCCVAMSPSSLSLSLFQICKSRIVPNAQAWDAVCLRAIRAGGNGNGVLLGGGEGPGGKRGNSQTIWPGASAPGEACAGPKGFFGPCKKLSAERWHQRLQHVSPMLRAPAANGGADGGDNGLSNAVRPPLQLARC